MEWTADKLTGVATGYWQSATLIAAVELGLFDLLSDESQTAEELSKKCGAQVALLPALLDALVAMELLAKYEGTYRIDSRARGLLSRSSPTCMLDALRYNADLYRQWGSLADVMRSGNAVVPQQKMLGLDPAMTRRFVYGMEAKARAFLPAIAPIIHLDGEKTLLDIGSGPGTLSRALVEKREGVELTLLDLPDVLNIAREICASSPAAARIHYHPADYRRDPLPSPVDGILYAGALHQETLESAQQLANRCFAALRPGGRVFIVDLMLDDDRTAPSFSALFQLTMILMRPAARVFSRREITDVLSAAGFDRIEAHHPASSPYRLVVAHRPKRSEQENS